MNFLRKNGIGLILLLILIGIGFFYRTSIVGFVRQQYNDLFPCSMPITYSVGEIDPRFGVSRAELVRDIQQAANIWEKAVDRDLFQYASSADGADLPINLIYDYRQQATVTLHKIDAVITNDRAGYDTIAAKYHAELASYNEEKSAFQARLETYRTAKASYENDVEYWNSKGGAPADQYASLERRRAVLNEETAAINQAQRSLNQRADALNATVQTLNDMAKKLNLNVQNYNTVGASTGPEFEEGEYVRDTKGRRINIYQFDDQNKFIRVLAHELGHALGLDHNSNPKSIMYAYNQGVNEKLTADDLSALKTRCRVK